MASPLGAHCDPAPSYEESERAASFSKSSGSDLKPSLESGQSMSLPLQHELANTRTQRIESILSTYVDPLLISQGAAGLYKTTFVLVPSSVSSLQDGPSDAFTAPQEPQVVGFSDEDVVRLVRLQGQEHAMEFWRQPAVVAELESSMKARLATSGHRIYNGSEQPEATVTPTPPNPSPKKDPKKSMWGRLKDHATTDSEIVDHKLGWRAPEPQSESLSGKIPTGMLQISVAWKDISLRIANEMGLYESKHGPALCLTVEVGT